MWSTLPQHGTVAEAQMMKNRWVIGGGVISAVLLFIFLTLQQFNAGILQLETRWIALASLPVLIGLLGKLCTSRQPAGRRMVVWDRDE
jgi:hypothetical protein